MNLLVTGAWKCSDEELDTIKDMGHSVVFMQNESDDIPCSYQWVEGVICNGLFLHHSIDKFKNLKYIQLTSQGYDRVDMDYVKENNITINNARGVYSVPMAEFVLSGVLALMKQGRFFYNNQKKNIWEKHRGLTELYSKTVLIVGCGNVGSECAKRFKAFDTKIIGADVVTNENPYIERIYHISELKSVLNTADVVVLTLPLLDSTYHIINEDMLSSMKEGAILANIARGGVVDTSALINALKSDRLSGAVLDVFESEPLEDNSPLWDMDNVVLTPHNSFVGDGNGDRLKRVIFDNLEQMKGM